MFSGICPSVSPTVARLKPSFVFAGERFEFRQHKTVGAARQSIAGQAFVLHNFDDQVQSTFLRRV